MDIEKDGRKGGRGSGVRGGIGGVSDASGASSKVAELIHLSSRVLVWKGDAVRRRKLSAK